MNLRIRDICKAKGITITGLAEKMNISKGALSQAITGNPTISTLEKTAAALGVSFIELFETNCPKCGMMFASAAEPPPAATPPPQKTKTDNTIFDFIEARTDKITDKIGIIGLKKHLKAYGGDGIHISQVDEKYRDGFIKYLQTAKRQNGWQAITGMYQKRMIGCLNPTCRIYPVKPPKIAQNRVQAKTYY